MVVYSRGWSFRARTVLANHHQVTIIQIWYFRHFWTLFYRQSCWYFKAAIDGRFPWTVALSTWRASKKWKLLSNFSYNKSHFCAHNFWTRWQGSQNAKPIKKWWNAITKRMWDFITLCNALWTKNLFLKKNKFWHKAGTKLIM